MLEISTGLCNRLDSISTVFHAKLGVGIGGMGQR